jgi:hypothetical protein
VTGLPVDLEVALHGWGIAARLRRLANEAEAAAALVASDNPKQLADILGTLLGNLDGIALELDAVVVVA